jgi:hypothetical protein
MFLTYDQNEPAALVSEERPVIRRFSVSFLRLAQPQISGAHFQVAQNRPNKTRAQHFARMDRNDRLPAVGVFQDYVTAAFSDLLETNTFESSYQFFPGNPGQSRHTAICCTPMSSSLLEDEFESSRQSSMASRTRFIKVSRFFAWVWHPGSAGTDATYKPASSRSITTVNFRTGFTVLPFQSSLPRNENTEIELGQKQKGPARLARWPLRK